MNRESPESPEPQGRERAADDATRIAAEVAADAGVELSQLRTEDQRFLKEHALKKGLGTPQIWALGVGAVITGEYFGWNPGLAAAGPIGMLIASLFVCALYMAWVLSLSELSVAMPFAGGPLAYGRRAVGPAFGFIMGWSMFLESLFATIGTAIATGGAVYFLVDLLAPSFTGSQWPLGLDPRLAVTTLMGLFTVALFAGLQCVGARQQAKVMEWMTYGAIAGLVWFWIAALPGVDLSRITEPGLVNGWEGVLRAIPYAIWWLVIIEAVALSAEEAREPERSIPRGLALAQITLIVLVVLTWFFVSATGSDYKKTGETSVLYPLQHVYREVWPGQEHAWHLAGFGLVALCGMVASYNGMIYAVSRQSFALGRAGYLPRFLGQLHAERRTPVPSILFWSLAAAGFVVWGYFNEGAIFVAVLTCNLTALIWYILAMVCLFVLRWKEPDMPRPYRVPWYPFLPAAVIVMSLFAGIVYGLLQERIVLKLTLGMYAAGLAYYYGFARSRLEAAAPEELAARAAQGGVSPDEQ